MCELPNNPMGTTVNPAAWKPTSHVSVTVLIGLAKPTPAPVAFPNFRPEPSDLSISHGPILQEGRGVFK